MSKSRIIGLMLISLLLGCGPSEPRAKPVASVIYSDARVTVLAPAQIYAEQLFSIELKFSQLPTELSARLVSQSMSMGIVPLLPVALGDGKYSAQTLLGRCSDAQMIWRLEIRWLINGEPQWIESTLRVMR